MMEHLKTQSTENVDTTLFLVISHNIEKRFKRVRIPFPAPHLRCVICAPQFFSNGGLRSLNSAMFHQKQKFCIHQCFWIDKINAHISHPCIFHSNIILNNVLSFLQKHGRIHLHLSKKYAKCRKRKGVCKLFPHIAFYAFAHEMQCGGFGAAKTAQFDDWEKERDGQRDANFMLSGRRDRHRCSGIDRKSVV